MSLFASPAWTAAFALGLCVLSHPALPLSGRPPQAALVAAALLLVLSVVARARSSAARLLLAAGVVTGAGAAGFDAVRGHEGSLSLVAGQGTRAFQETGPGGKPLGLRPISVDVRLEAIGAGGEAMLSGGVRLTRSQATRVGDLRMGAPRVESTGRVASLRLGIAGGGEAQEIALIPGTPARVGELEIALEQYFPDFALDAKGQPFTRSNQPRNPATLLRVSRGSATWRLFVIRSMPGIHAPEGLDRSFTLLSVEPESQLTLRVARQPAAPLAAGGMLLVALGLALEFRRR